MSSLLGTTHKKNAGDTEILTGDTPEESNNKDKRVRKQDQLGKVERKVLFSLATRAEDTILKICKK